MKLRTATIIRRLIGHHGLLVASLLACSPEQNEADAHPLSGTWVRVFPPEGALDTLMLHADGRFSGSAAGLDTMPYPFDRWIMGTPIMPGGFCVGNSERRHCMGYLVRGDTLFLANQRRTVLVRAPTDGRVLAPLPRIDAGATAPKPGEAVRVNPAMKPQP